MQFPFVLLGRAILHHGLVASRTHAQRTVLKVGNGSASAKPDILPDGAVREFAPLFTRVQRTEPGSASRSAALVDLTQSIGRLIRTAPKTTTRV
jgi:hypothetical protein